MKVHKQNDAMETALTVGELRRMLRQLKVPDGAKIQFAVKKPFPGWEPLKYMSFCRTVNEVSLW